MSATEADFPPDLRTLERDYELIRELGRGGMAAVYLARERATRRLVAIKAVRARYLDDEEAIRRFAREAHTVAGLDHPNIVRTYEIKQLDERAVAIVMQHVSGGTVRDWLRERGALSAEHAESVLRDIAEALRYAHARGIVHRDVKPENIFLDETSGRALLSDFGIARPIEGDSGLTMLGSALGTPQYMSPEQVDGRPVDGRSDIYSLGVLGWELLTGRRPWAGESLYGVIYKQKHEHLERITTIRPRVPANLLFAIEGALVKDRERRWQSVDQFLTQLTYNPPPVLAHPYLPGAPPPADEPTVQFRSNLLDLAPDGTPARPSDWAAIGVGQEGDLSRYGRGAEDPAQPYGNTLDRRDDIDEVGGDGEVEESDPAATADVFGLPPLPPAEEYEPSRPARRAQIARAAGVFVPAVVTVVALAIVLGGRPTTSAGVTRTDLESRQTSGGNVALLPERPRRSGELDAPLPRPVLAPDSGSPLGTVADATTGGAASDSVGNETIEPALRETSPTPPPPRPRRTVNRAPTFRVEQRADSTPAPATTPGTSAAAAPAGKADSGARRAGAPVRADSSAGDDSATRGASSGDAGAGAGGLAALARCELPTTADQRACLVAHIERNDERLDRVYRALISELRGFAGTDAGAPDPPTVRRLRIEQRAWLSVRDVECRRETAGREGTLWARERVPCFVEMATFRADELQEAVKRLRRER